MKQGKKSIYFVPRLHINHLYMDTNIPVPENCGTDPYRFIQEAVMNQESGRTCIYSWKVFLPCVTIPSVRRSGRENGNISVCMTGNSLTGSPILISKGVYLIMNNYSTWIMIRGKEST